MKPLFIGVLPNYEADDYALARRLLFSKADEKWDEEFSRQLLSSFYPQITEADKIPADIYTVDSARSAFYMALKALDLPKYESLEVIMPGFTCVVVLNPVLWSGLKPVFADVEEGSFNTSIQSILERITEKTRVIMVQHTFGAVIQTDELRNELKMLGRDDIIIVEDLAHSLGVNYGNGKKVGTEADMAISTFGVEKMMTTIRGGALLINHNSRTERILDRARDSFADLPELPGFYQLKILFNPLFWSIAIPLYSVGFGKFTLGRALVLLGHKLGLLGIEIDKKEYSGGKPDYLPAKLPVKLARLGIKQLGKLGKLNKYRRELSKKYSKAIAGTNLSGNPEQKFIANILEHDLPHAFMRYPLVFADKSTRNEFIMAAKQKGIIIGDWYKTMFYTDPKHLGKLGYEEGSCLITEDLKDRVVNLPTSINVSEKHLRVITMLIKVYGE